MAEFKIIETQEQLDSVIAERIRRAEQKAAEKYADYDSLKQANTDYAAQIAQLSEQLQQQAETISGHQAIVDGLNQKVQKYETDSVKTKIALETGLPYKLAERLTGEDEEAIRADAQAIKALMSAQDPVAPLGASEPRSSEDQASAAWLSISQNLRSES